MKKILSIVLVTIISLTSISSFAMSNNYVSYVTTQSSLVAQ